MTPETFVGPLIGAVIIIGMAIVGHAIHDAYKQGKMESDIKNLKEQVGTRETGLTGSLHKQGNIIARIQGGLLFIADKLKISIKRDGEE